MAILHPERLTQVHPKLIAVIKKAAAALPYDITVIQGIRTDEQCYENFGKGRTAAQCIAGNCPAKYAQPHLAKVTWLGHALSCNHRKKADGFGHAVDVFAGSWTDKAKLLEDYHVIMQAAKDLGAHVRYGGDWNQNGKLEEKGETDLVHFELL